MHVDEAQHHEDVQNVLNLEFLSSKTKTSNTSHKNERRREKPFSMEERKKGRRREEEEREERNRFIPSFFLPLLFLAVLVSLFLSDATTTTPSRNFLSATGHVNYVGRRDENLGHQGSSNNDEESSIR